MFLLPISSQQYTNQALLVTEKNIASAIRYARAQSSIMGVSLVLEPIKGDDWSFGIRVCPEQSDDASHCLREWKWPSSQVKLVWHGFRSQHRLVFTPELNHYAVNGYFLMESTFSQPVKLIVNRLGRVRYAVMDHAASKI